MTKEQELQKEIDRLREALTSIARILDPDNEDSYRCDDPEGAMDTAHFKAKSALAPECQ